MNLLRMNVLRLLAGLMAALVWVNTASAEATSAHDFSFTAIDGEPLAMSGYDGKVVLLVNTASFCGFTPQYSGLQSLWERYSDRGLVVLGVPSNDFGAQEPGSEAEIKEFCEANYLVDFPLTSKQVVSGSSAHPLYRWLVGELGDGSVPRWNFHKYLIGADGQALQAWSTRTEPMSDTVTSAIEAALAE